MRALLCLLQGESKPNGPGLSYVLGSITWSNQPQSSLPMCLLSHTAPTVAAADLQSAEASPAPGVQAGGSAEGPASPRTGLHVRVTAVQGNATAETTAGAATAAAEEEECAVAAGAEGNAIAEAAAEEGGNAAAAAGERIVIAAAAQVCGGASPLPPSAAPAGKAPAAVRDSKAAGSDALDPPGSTLESHHLTTGCDSVDPVSSMVVVLGGDQAAAAAAASVGGPCHDPATVGSDARAAEATNAEVAELEAASAETELLDGRGGAVGECNGLQQSVEGECAEHPGCEQQEDEQQQPDQQLKEEQQPGEQCKQPLENVQQQQQLAGGQQLDKGRKQQQQDEQQQLSDAHTLHKEQQQHQQQEPQLADKQELDRDQVQQQQQQQPQLQPQQHGDGSQGNIGSEQQGDEQQRQADCNQQQERDHPTEEREQCNREQQERCSLEQQQQQEQRNGGSLAGPLWQVSHVAGEAAMADASALQPHVCGQLSADTAGLGDSLRLPQQDQREKGMGGEQGPRSLHERGCRADSVNNLMAVTDELLVLLLVKGLTLLALGERIWEASPLVGLLSQAVHLRAGAADQEDTAMPAVGSDAATHWGGFNTEAQAAAGAQAAAEVEAASAAGAGAPAGAQTAVDASTAGAEAAAEVNTAGSEAVAGAKAAGAPPGAGVQAAAEAKGAAAKAAAAAGAQAAAEADTMELEAAAEANAAGGAAAEGISAAGISPPGAEAAVVASGAGGKNMIQAVAGAQVDAGEHAAAGAGAEGGAGNEFKAEGLRATTAGAAAAAEEEEGQAAAIDAGGGSHHTGVAALQAAAKSAGQHQSKRQLLAGTDDKQHRVYAHESPQPGLAALSVMVPAAMMDSGPHLHFTVSHTAAGGLRTQQPHWRRSRRQEEQQEKQRKQEQQKQEQEQQKQQQEGLLAARGQGESERHIVPCRSWPSISVAAGGAPGGGGVGSYQTGTPLDDIPPELQEWVAQQPYAQGTSSSRQQGPALTRPRSGNRLPDRMTPAATSDVPQDVHWHAHDDGFLVGEPAREGGDTGWGVNDHRGPEGSSLGGGGVGGSARGEGWHAGTLSVKGPLRTPAANHQHTGGHWRPDFKRDRFHDGQEGWRRERDDGPCPSVGLGKSSSGEGCLIAGAPGRREWGSAAGASTAPSRSAHPPPAVDVRGRGFACRFPQQEEDEDPYQRLLHEALDVGLPQLEEIAWDAPVQGLEGDRESGMFGLESAAGAAAPAARGHVRAPARELEQQPQPPSVWERDVGPQRSISYADRGRVAGGIGAVRCREDGEGNHSEYADDLHRWGQGRGEHGVKRRCFSGPNSFVRHAELETTVSGGLSRSQNAPAAAAGAAPPSAASNAGAELIGMKPYMPHPRADLTFRRLDPSASVGPSRVPGLAIRPRGDMVDPTGYSTWAGSRQHEQELEERRGQRREGEGNMVGGYAALPSRVCGLNTLQQQGLVKGPSSQQQLIRDSSTEVLGVQKRPYEPRGAAVESSHPERHAPSPPKSSTRPRALSQQQQQQQKHDQGMLADGLQSNDVAGSCKQQQQQQPQKLQPQEVSVPGRGGSGAIISIVPPLQRRFSSNLTPAEAAEVLARPPKKLHLMMQPSATAAAEAPRVGAAGGGATSGVGAAGAAAAVEAAKVVDGCGGYAGTPETAAAGQGLTQEQAAPAAARPAYDGHMGALPGLSPAAAGECLPSPSPQSNSAGVPMTGPAAAAEAAGGLGFTAGSLSPAAAASGDAELKRKRSAGAAAPVKSVHTRVSRFPESVRQACKQEWEQEGYARVVCNGVVGLLSVVDGRCMVTFDSGNGIQMLRGVADYLRFAGELRIKKWRRHVRMVGKWA